MRLLVAEDLAGPGAASRLCGSGACTVTLLTEPENEPLQDGAAQGTLGHCPVREATGSLSVAPGPQATGITFIPGVELAQQALQMPGLPVLFFWYWGLNPSSELCFQALLKFGLNCTSRAHT